jgi:glycosyltransferase involved in cell wall biosynthesis
MKICMVVGSLLDFGGLEEFATELAVGVHKGGQQVSVLTTCWVPPHNQYLRKLVKNGVQVVQLPRWLSLAISDWGTKEKILKVLLSCLSPLIFLMGLGVCVGKRRPLGQSVRSARGWLGGKIMSKLGPDRRQPFARLLLGWWRLRWRPDVIHIQGYTSTLLFVIDWAYAKKIPVIYEEHQTPDAQFDWWKDFAKTINKSSMVVAVSEQSAKAMRDVCGVTQPIATVYYMVPDPLEAGWVPPETPQVDSDRPIRVTTLARLYVTKGLNYLLDCIVDVLKVHPSTQFRVYGDGELRDELLAYAEKLGLDGNKIFVGAFTSREELARVMTETDIFAMSSILEGLPVALLEAMSFGRTIIATPAGGTAEAIKDGINGLLCPLREPACLARKICALIEDPALRRRLGQAARKSYEEGPYKPAAVCSRYVSIYETVLGNTRVQRSGASA